MSSPRRTVLIVALGAVALAIIGGVLVGGPRVASALGLGKQLEEANGQTKTTSYKTAADAAAAGHTPAWLPMSATKVTVEIPGPQSKSPGGTQLDAVVPADYALPATCTSATTSFPWAGGWDTLNVPSAKLSKCDGWTATVQSERLYAWRY